MFSFPEACRNGDKLRQGWGILGNSLFFLSNVLVIALMGRLFLGAGEDGVYKGWLQSVML
jgi:hypothetical protein